MPKKTTRTQMTLREVFDVAALHMLAQGERSHKWDKKLQRMRCKYRGPGGLMCPAGALISDTHYRPQLEGKLACASPAVNAALVNSGVPESALLLVSDLQNIHDAIPTDEWLTQLKFKEDELTAQEKAGTA